MEESTADIYGSDDRIFVGDFVESRAKVDFNFHRNYQIERQLLQDRIVHQHLKLGKTADLPKIIFLAGVMGAGKGYVLEKMGNSGQIYLQDYIWIDSDKIKQQAIKYIEKYINKENEIENYISFEDQFDFCIRKNITM